MDADILADKYMNIEYYLKRGDNLYFRNNNGKLRIDGSGTVMEKALVYGQKYNIELSIFADSNEF